MYYVNSFNDAHDRINEPIQGFLVIGNHVRALDARTCKAILKGLDKPLPNASLTTLRELVFAAIGLPGLY